MLSEATVQHPAQVQVYHEEVTIGRYEISRQSGAFSVKQKEQLLNNVRKLKAAVLFSREQANSDTLSRPEKFTEEKSLVGDKLKLLLKNLS